MGEKKESWIAKLIELLNEYHHFNSDLIYYWWDKEYEKVYFHSELPEKEKEKLRKAGIYNEEDDWVDEDWIWDEWICSKKFWFIQWLVENDKIDTSKANEKNLNGYEIELRIRAVKELVADSEEKTVLYLNLLMLLAIQEQPIRFLCEIIK